MTTKPNNESTTETGSGRTETPWTLYPHPLVKNIIPVGCFEIEDRTSGLWKAITQDKETAEKIIKAVNSHARLLAERDALKAALEAEAEEHETQAELWASIADSENAEYHAKWGKQARALLATLAEGSK